MSLRDLQKRHMRGILGNANGVAEEVTYQFASGGADRTFNAFVSRDLEGADGDINRRSCVVSMPRHAELGVEAVVPGRDKVVLPVRVSEAPKACRVMRIVAEDAAKIVVEVSE